MHTTVARPIRKGLTLTLLAAALSLAACASVAAEGPANAPNSGTPSAPAATNPVPSYPVPAFPARIPARAALDSPATRAIRISRSPVPLDRTNPSPAMAQRM